MKYGQTASKELADFIRERSSIEEVQSRFFLKIAKQASNGCAHGTFAPIWQLLKASSEKLSTLHQQMVHKFQDLIKDIHKYYDELHKKHKSVKEEESGTLDVVQAIQATTAALLKSKEVYHARCLEYERLKRENGSPKDVEKAEVKFRKARVMLINMPSIRDDFEHKMSLSCNHYQTIEEEHLNQMKTFLLTYAKVIEKSHSLIGQVNIEFREKCDEMTVDKLLEQFVTLKNTGTARPGLIEFEEADLSSLSQLPTPDQLNSSYTEKLHIKKEGFLKSKRDKKKEKKKKKKSESKEELVDILFLPLLTNIKLNKIEFILSLGTRSQMISKWKRMIVKLSDDDSDDEREKKIHVEIKPVSNGSAPMSVSVDELRATVGSLSLSPPVGALSMKKGSSLSVDVDSSMHRSSTSSQQFKPSNDLMGLNLFSPPTSISSTPTCASEDRSKSPALSVETPTQNSVVQGPPSSQSNGAVTLRGGTPTSAIPRPSSRKSGLENSRGRMSPNVSQMSRADSVGSLGNVSVDFKSTSMPIGSSRGPSPLTIGMSDTIPIAVAFQEVVHAYFKGTEESRLFPAGIVQVLANNPNPAVLSFKIKNTSKMTNIIPNKQLISNEVPGAEEYLYDFNMQALTSLLKRQSEQAPTASYYNVDIIKYQIKAMPGARSTPLQLVSYWKCEQNNTDLRVDYKYNPLAMSIIKPLTNLSIYVPVDGSVNNMQSKPSGSWSSETNCAVWRIPELSTQSDGGGLGSLRARFDLSSGPTTPSQMSVQFACEGTSSSGVEFELAGLGYRLSLVKKRCIAGKYLLCIQFYI
ncbi:F-BAR domain only protein 2 [Nymphon striatum]|nr:F-BAR domain only protein 2 [Nymphon striatum]